MWTRTYVFILGFLAICIGLIVTGFWLPKSWYSGLMLTVGILGCVVWAIGLFYLSNAMNSDI